MRQTGCARDLTSTCALGRPNPVSAGTLSSSSIFSACGEPVLWSSAPLHSLSCPIGHSGSWMSSLGFCITGQPGSSYFRNCIEKHTSFVRLRGDGGEVAASLKRTHTSSERGCEVRPERLAGDRVCGALWATVNGDLWQDSWQEDPWEGRSWEVSAPPSDPRPTPGF